MLSGGDGERRPADAKASRTTLGTGASERGAWARSAARPIGRADFLQGSGPSFAETSGACVWVSLFGPFNGRRSSVHKEDKALRPIARERFPSVSRKDDGGARSENHPKPVRKPERKLNDARGGPGQAAPRPTDSAATTMQQRCNNSEHPGEDLPEVARIPSCTFRTFRECKEKLPGRKSFRELGDPKRQPKPTRGNRLGLVQETGDFSW